RTVVADETGVIFVNPTGNPGMATAGSGDVLAGMIASFLAQGMAATDAAVCGVYLHGAAGDRAAARLSQQALIASDLIDELPELFLQL
ncbi:MAG: hydroxyethylthiazole kinase, partial [Clostridia bacterium]|nr:hydroxyethylthiazole kinase [Clostridia bacterium]